jgi:hypothetical protein
VQTPLSDEPAEDSADDEDKDCADFSELLEFFAELDKATEQLDRSSIEDSDDEEPSPTAAGELSESPHATSANGTTSKPASKEAITATEVKRSFNFITLIYIKKTQPGEAAFSYLKLRNWSFLDHV